MQKKLTEQEKGELSYKILKDLYNYSEIVLSDGIIFYQYNHEYLYIADIMGLNEGIYFMANAIEAINKKAHELKIKTIRFYIRENKNEKMKEVLKKYGSIALDWGNGTVLYEIERMEV